MELTLTGTPLDALQESFLDLTARLEAKAIDLDQALHELQSREVVDASGHTWRIDPVSRSFVRRAPGPNASWLPATPADYIAPTTNPLPTAAPTDPTNPTNPTSPTGGAATSAAAPPGPTGMAAPTAPLPGSATPPALPETAPLGGPATSALGGPAAPALGGPAAPALGGSAAAGLPGVAGLGGLSGAVARRSGMAAAVARSRAVVPVPREVARRFRALSWRWYAVGGVVVTVAAVAGTIVLSGSSSKGAAKTPAAAKPRAVAAVPSARPGVIGQGLPVPDSATYNSAITEIESGDPGRIAKVADSGPYGAADRRLFAATYAGWAAEGFTVKAESPVGTAARTATQVWELRDHGTVIGIASVTWTRTGPKAPWRLAAWPAFHAPA